MYRTNSNGVASALPPSPWSAMPRSSWNGQIYIPAEVHSLKMKPQLIFLIESNPLIFRRTFLSKTDMNSMGWAGGGGGKTTKQKFLLPVSHSDCTIIPGCCQLAHSKELSPSSTWWQKGRSGCCCGRRTGLQGDGDSLAAAAILHEWSPFCVALAYLLSRGGNSPSPHR